MQKGLGALFIVIIVAAIAGVGFFVFKGLGSKNFPQNYPFIGSNEFHGSSVKDKFEVFPAKLEDFQVPPKAYGLWPYGVKGNDSNSHNEGHPGWDFELKKGSKLYAISDLRINQIHDGDHQTGGGQVIKVIEASARLKEGDIGIVYHSVINIEKNIVEGATIKAGSVLAEVGFPLSDESAMIHFGIFVPNDRVGVCPTRYFSDELQETINKVVENSIDDKIGKPYPSACVGKISKEIYYKNFPDQVKDLGGGEEWE